MLGKRNGGKAKFGSWDSFGCDEKKEEVASEGVTRNVDAGGMELVYLKEFPAAVSSGPGNSVGVWSLAGLLIGPVVAIAF